MSFYVMSSTKWYSAERHSAEFNQVSVILLSGIQVSVILLSDIQVSVILLSDIQVWAILLELIE